MIHMNLQKKKKKLIDLDYSEVLRCWIMSTGRVTDVSKKCGAFIYRDKQPEDGGIKIFRNVRRYLLGDSA
jgi:hypothetical protein